MTSPNSYSSSWFRTQHLAYPEILYDENFPIEQMMNCIVQRDLRLWHSNAQQYRAEESTQPYVYSPASTPVHVHNPQFDMFHVSPPTNAAHVRIPTNPSFGVPVPHVLPPAPIQQGTILQWLLRASETIEDEDDYSTDTDAMPTYGPFTLSSQTPQELETVATLLRLATQTFVASVPIVPSADQLRNGTTILSNGSSAMQNCAVCQDSIDQYETIRRINTCGHTFHQSCIDNWFTSHVTCPICRHDVRDVPAV